MLVNTEVTGRIGGLVNQTVDDDLAGDIGAGLLHRDGEINQTPGRPRSRFAVTADDAHTVDEDHAHIAILGRPRGGDHRFPTRRQHLRQRRVVHAKIKLQTMFGRLFQYGLRKRSRRYQATANCRQRTDPEFSKNHFYLPFILIFIVQQLPAQLPFSPATT